MSLGMPHPLSAYDYLDTARHQPRDHAPDSGDPDSDAPDSDACPDPDDTLTVWAPR